MNKFVLIAGLVLASQGFAANCAADYVPPENPVWDGSTKTQPCTKDGFYIIDNAAKLAWYGANYNSGNAKLTADIDLGGYLWIPLAAGKGDKFYGKIFDGQNHIIKNLYVNGDELSALNKEYAQNLGFVGVLGDGKVLNLVLENVDIQATTNAGTIINNQDNQISVGAVVGWMSDKGTNVVDNCISSGVIKTTGISQGVGGIVGNAKKGTISNCMSLVEIQTSGSKAYIGGIVGITKTDVTVSSCVYAGPGLTNTGTNGSVGGITGNVWSGTMTAQNSYFEGNLTYNGNAVGGVGKTCKDCTVNDTTVNTSEINQDSIACALNGIDSTTGACKTEPWSVGETSLSLNGYGADGYKIVFDANGGVFANGKPSKNKFLDGGMSITADEIENPTRENYSFAGWAKTRDATAPAADLGTVFKRDSVFAVWKPVYTITFNVAPGVFPETNKDKGTKDVAEGAIITVEGLGALPESYCSKYDSVHVNDCATTSYFTGWALNPGTSFPDTLDLKDISATDGLVLYAVWDTVETYTVTYNANQHGRTTVDYVRVGAGDTVTTPIDPIADDGYEFDGWFTDAEGENPYDFASKIKESIVLYAKWALQRFDITYVMNEGTDTGDNPSSYTIDTSFALKAPTDIEGYVFEGWFYDAAFTNKATQVIQGTTGDKTFYGKWTKKTYRIMYLADNDSYGSISNQFVAHGSTITLESAGIFRRAGYEQDGWSTTMGGAKEYELGASVTVVAPVTLYPTWSLATYTITYECDGCVNNPQNPTTYTYNDQKGIKFGTPREGYSFAGWFKEPDYTTQVMQIKKNSYGDITLYGKQLVLYKITYVGTEQARNDSLYTVESVVTFRDPAPREGYTFDGWYDNAEFEGDAVTGIAKGSTGDTTFYAKWIPESVETQYGAITITESNTKVDGEIVTTRTAVINGNYGGGDEPNLDEADTVEITSDITVNSVTLNRTFNAGKIATLYVPFEIDAENVVGTEVYKFKTVVKSDVDNRWKFKVSTATKIMPNTPYVVIPVGTQVTFNITDPVTLNTTTDGGETTSANNWEFVGAYQYEKFAINNDNPIYLFANEERNGAKLGEFVKINDGAYINPMRAYLVYHKSEAMQKSARGNFGSGIALPDELDIEIENENGIVVQTGTLNTVTGEVRMDRWFDLKGRKLNAKPTAKGTYYKNGKRVIIK
ncbi:MAG: InlB B-repeat-containing protein [Fibrobacter sp.]|nr:InlB B-repeat-containing protein [Fibrobacter sp.]